MWKFRHIGDYYELLDGVETLYLCKRLDSIMVTTLEDLLEDLCARHNKEVAVYENMDTDIISCDEAYLNGLEDGREEAAQKRYDESYLLGKVDGYGLGYRRGLADAIACEDKLT